MVVISGDIDARLDVSGTAQRLNKSVGCDTKLYN